MSKTQVTKSSRIWLDRQNRDPFFKQSKKDGYRSRAAYKLLELQAKYNFLKPGMKIIDLGAAPGSWSQIASNIVIPNKYKEKIGKVIAIDLLPIEPIKNVDIINGDFTSNLIFEQICSLVETCTYEDNKKVDVILSDMAPNLSGIWAIDIHKAMNLSYIAFDLVKRVLKPEGSFFIKLFSGEGFKEYLIMLRQYFAKVIIFKPKSSRLESREVYAFANNFLTVPKCKGN